MSNSPFIHGGTRDVSMWQRQAGIGMRMDYWYVKCDHKAPRRGGMFRQDVPWLCPACTEARAAKAE